jgi:hypothetical protein
MHLACKYATEYGLTSSQKKQKQKNSLTTMQWMIKKENGRSHDIAEIIMETNLFIFTSEVAVLFIGKEKKMV